jgi:predicted dinucleotide-binding enzyme
MKIGILGSGTVGTTLAKGFLKHGYTVKIGTRAQDKVKSIEAELQKNGITGSFADAASFGEIIVLAVKGSAAKSALQLAGSDALNGKTVIDATNPIADAPPVNGVLRFFTSLDSSLMEQLQEEYPEAHFVKAFNSIGAAFMVNPDFNGVRPTMFICGNDSSSKKSVSGILTKFGFDVEDMGKAEAARAIEPLCMLWCIPGFMSNDWSPHAFKLLRK